VSVSVLFFFFFNDTATTEIYTLSLHDALPIYKAAAVNKAAAGKAAAAKVERSADSFLHPCFRL